MAAAGHASLREISREDVLDTLPAAGNPIDGGARTQLDISYSGLNLTDIRDGRL